MTVNTYTLILKKFLPLAITYVLISCTTPSASPNIRPFVNFQDLACRPEYPKAAIQFNQQGIVSLEALVAVDGTLSAIEITSSSGFPLLDQAIVVALNRHQCKAKPGAINGISTEMPMKLQYKWKID